MTNKSQHTKIIKEEAIRLGFSSVGIAKANFLHEESPRLEKWLKKGYQGQMSYLKNYFDERLDPRLLVENAKSIISLSFNYYPEKEQVDNTYKIARYAYGKDYHKILKKKGKTLIQFIQEKIGDVNARFFVDSAPVMERTWAVKSGLGWIGKNGLLLQKKAGSYFFLAELIIDLELNYNKPFKTNHCGQCTKCIDACPTQAILDNAVLDASKCISYLTIELKESIPETFKSQYQNWIFGCDICQEVCPWNSFSLPHLEKSFYPNENLITKSKNDWENLSEENFNNLFQSSALKRTGYKGLKRNIEFLKS